MTKTKSKKIPTFKVGDKVVSTREGGLPGLLWRAEIYKVMPAKQTPDGFCYETLGRWEVVDASLVGDWYKEEKRPTLRQLWSDCLAIDEAAMAAPKTVYVRDNRTLYPVTEEQAAAMQAKYRDAVLANGMGPRDVPEIKLCDEYGRTVGHISWNGTMVMKGGAS